MYKTAFPGEGNRNEAMDLVYGLIVQRTVRSLAVTIGNTATPIPATPLRYRKSLWIFNNSSNVIYLGADDVSTVNGFPIYPRGEANVQIEDGVVLYGISAAGGDVIRILEGA